MIKILFLLLLFPFSGFGQTEKSIKPIYPPSSGQGATFAVVIGISDYQDEDIPDLRFADRDAAAFASFLRSQAGGSLDEDHIKVLINQEATSGHVAEALDALIELAKADDRIIIYFSGHGDVEHRKVSQQGFLLCWNAPSRCYTGGGTYALDDLKEVITTLSVQNKTRVVVITDACHAGKLSGSQIGGAQLTASNMARQYSNELKILSCQPYEFSLEGTQWGGGRGCFSYHLLEGLYGLADKNGDNVVSVSEIDHYLEDRVTKEAAPHQQIPLVLGDRTQHLSTIDSGLLMQLQLYKQGQIPQFSPTEGRVFEEKLLAGRSPLSMDITMDSSVWSTYYKFRQAIKAKRLLEPAGDCAEEYYRQLTDMVGLAPLHGFIRRNYAAALQDSAQQAVNAILKINLQEISQNSQKRAQQYRDFPQLLSRAAELLGYEHYMYNTLKSRQLMFEGLVLFLQTYASRDQESGRPVLEKYRQSLVWQPESPITHYYMSLCFALKMNQPDSAIVHAQLATDFAETWVYPYAHLAYYLSRYYKRYEDAKVALDKAMAIDSNSVAVWTGLGSVYHYQGNYKEALQAYQKVLQLDSTNALAWANLGVEYGQIKQYNDAEKALHKALQLNPNQIFARYVLGCLSIQLKKPAEAEEAFLEALKINPGHTASRDSLAHIYLTQKKWKEAEIQFLELTKHNPAYSTAWYQLACLAAVDGRPIQALEWLEEALLKGYKNIESLHREPRLSTLRSTKNFWPLIQKYFPDTSKE